MEGPRAAKKEELQQVIQLINDVFRKSENYPETMQQEFPLLLCEENLDNIRIVSDNNMPVAAVNYYSTDIITGESIIRAASIGAVCTSPQYRGKNLATQILDDVEAKLQKENTDIMLISGTRSLYLNRGCCIVGGFLSAELVNPSFEKDAPGIDKSSGREFYDISGKKVEKTEFNREYLYRMQEIYNNENPRYIRGKDEFYNLMMGATTSWDGASYKIFMIKSDDQAKGYVVLKINSLDKDWGYVVEYAGDRETVYGALYDIMPAFNLRSITVVMSKGDKFREYTKNDQVDVSEQNQSGSVKIINYDTFMNKLKPYFRQNFECETMEFYKNDNGCIFKIDNEELCIPSLIKVTEIIFGGHDKNDMDALLKDSPLIKNFMDKVFPLPFPWAGNMNFI